MSFYKVELKEHFNHRLFYEKPVSLTNDEIGLENSYILMENNNLLNKSNFNNVDFFCEFGDNDNIVCLGQTLTINKKAKRIHLLAISTWIDTVEFFDIVYDDKTVERIKIPFLNWIEISGTNCELYYYEKEENVTTVSQTVTTGYFKRIVCFHHSYANLNANKKIKKIVLPDNLLIHIFAITLED